MSGEKVAGQACGPTPAAVRRLVRDYPLAWVLSPGAPAEAAALLPLLGRFDDADVLTGLVGHMSRRNPLCSALSGDPRVQVLFTGPQGYVSPHDSGRRDWGPTWNYAALRIDGLARLDGGLTAPAVDELVAAAEAGQPDPWTAAELGGRQQAMLDRIIGFTIEITTLAPAFKLGEDEDEDVLRSILTRHADPVLRDWMAQANARRQALDPDDD